MEKISMGARIRELRGERRLALRELARRAELSPSFLSEIESGRRYPSGEVLSRLASELGIHAADLHELDMRGHLADLKKLLASDPAWGLAFERIAEAADTGKLTPAKLVKWISRK